MWFCKSVINVQTAYSLKKYFGIHWSKVKKGGLGLAVFKLYGWTIIPGLLPLIAVGCQIVRVMLHTLEDICSTSSYALWFFLQEWLDKGMGVWPLHWQGHSGHSSCDICTWSLHDGATVWDFRSVIVLIITLIWRYSYASLPIT